MIAALGLRLSAFFRATAPDPFVLAVLLTGLTFVLALALTGAGPGELVSTWGGPEGVWSLLAFGMQMCLILVTGHALASSPPVSRALAGLSALPRTGAQGAALVSLVACVLGVCNWGLGLIAGALLARRVGASMASRGVPAHYPLLAASGYTGMLVWHGGFSGSAPLKVTTQRDIDEVFGAGSGVAPMGLDQTLLSPLNLVVTGGLVVLAPVLVWALSPRDPALAEPAESFVPEPPPAREREAKALVPRVLEDTPLVTLVLVGLIGWWAWRFYVPGEGRPSGLLRLSPDSVNLTMLLLGLIFHGTPARYGRAVEEAARGCAGIILQFPLYAGIMGMMKASGLTALLAERLASGAGEKSLPLLTYLSAGVVNLLVPSGGGQWAVQGPVAVEAARATGVDPARMVMAIAYGDQLTNMLQPFWALPLLAITGVKARDIVGYTAIIMVGAGLWSGLWLVVL